MPNIHSAFKIFLNRQRWWKIPQTGWASNILVALLITKSPGWACVFCRRTILTYANKHICSAKNQRTCHDCSRIIMRKDLYYKTYLRTRDMYCDSGYANDYRVKCYLTKENVGILTSAGFPQSFEHAKAKGNTCCFLFCSSKEG